MGEKRPDIFAFQETHSTSDDKKMWRKQFGKTGLKVLFSHSTEHSRGILLGFSERLNCKVTSSYADPEGRFIVANVKLNGEPFTIVALYLDPKIAANEMMQVLASIMERIALGGNSRVVMCGDFNTIIDPGLDHGRGSTKVDPKYTYKGKRIQGFMETHEFSDIWQTGHPQEHRYTSFSTGVLTRIDLTLGSAAFMTHVEDAFIGTSFASDHSPVYVDFTLEQQEQGKGYWKLPAYLLTDPVYVKRIENVIDSTLKVDPNCAWDPGKTWDYLKLAVDTDSIKYIGDCHSAKKQWVKQLDADIQVLTEARDKAAVDSGAVKSYSHKIQYMQLEREELVAFHTQRARNFNMARKHYETNRPTKYYYRLPGCKYDAIKRLVNNQGHEILDTAGILTECKSYYNSLYNKVPHPDVFNEDLQFKFLQNLPIAASREHADLLDRALSKTELHEALKRMKPDSAPGLDGLTVPFYLKFWDKLADTFFQFT